jgi:hypothetical protein
MRETNIIQLRKERDLPDFPECWDSTIRSAFANCPRKGYWEFIRNLRKPGGNIHLLFGGCFAKAMEVARKSYYIKGLSPTSAQVEGIIAATQMWEAGDGDELVPHVGLAANKTYAALIDGIDSYFERWSLDSDLVRPLELPNGELFIEKTFAFPIPGTSHPQTRKPIIYAGRLDMLGVWKDTGLNIVVDEKTSSQLGERWSSNWPMRMQITGYCKGAEIYGFKIRHAHIRGIGILKNDITFAEEIQNRDRWRIDRGMEQIRRDINRATEMYTKMSEDLEHGLEYHWDTNEDSACSSYGRGCQFIPLCTSQKPERWVHNYDEVIWNPLADRTAE